MKHQNVIKRKIETGKSIIIYKYAKLDMFHHYRRFQLYMYDFMYVKSETFPLEDHFPATKNIVVKYKKISTQVIVPKHCLGFCYICSEYYELDKKSDDIETFKKIIPPIQ